MTTETVTCLTCSGDGATYTQVRVGQFSTPFVCPDCAGDGEISTPAGNHAPIPEIRSEGEDQHG